MYCAVKGQYSDGQGVWGGKETGPEICLVGLGPSPWVKGGTIPEMGRLVGRAKILEAAMESSIL